MVQHENEQYQNQAVVRLFSDVQSKSLNWLWYPYIPYGKVTILQGDPGDGKTTFAVNVAAILSKGGVFPEESEAVKAANVIYQTTEDDYADTIKPKLEAAGADCQRVGFISDREQNLTLEDPRFEEAVRSMKAKLLIIDPIQAFVPKDGNLYQASKMRMSMQRLSWIAERYQCAILLIGHMTKSKNSKQLYRGLGSIDITASVRSVLMITRDHLQPEIRYMFPVKSNIAIEGDAIGFIFTEMGFRWIGKCRINKDELAEPVSIRISKKSQAQELIRILLADHEMASKEFMEKMESFGLRERTIRQAQKELGVYSVRRNNAWHVGLPSGKDDEEEEEELV